MDFTPEMRPKMRPKMHTRQFWSYWIAPLLPVVSFTVFLLVESRDGVVACLGAAAAPANGEGYLRPDIFSVEDVEDDSGGRTYEDSAQYPRIFLSVRFNIKLLEIWSCCFLFPYPMIHAICGVSNSTYLFSEFALLFWDSVPSQAAHRGPQLRHGRGRVLRHEHV